MNNMIKEEIIYGGHPGGGISMSKNSCECRAQMPEAQMKIGEMINTIELQQCELNAITNEIEYRFSEEPKVQQDRKTDDPKGYEGRLIDIIEHNRILIRGLSNILDRL